MKKFLLAGLFLGMALPQVGASALTDRSMSVGAEALKVNVNPVKLQATAGLVSSKAAGKSARIQVLDNEGLTFKRIATSRGNKTVNPRLRSAARAESATSSQVLLNESFENPGTDASWLPEGWTVESKGDADLDAGMKWGVGQSDGMFLPTPTDGDWAACINFSTGQKQDEWLISPEVSVPDADYDLSFDLYQSPMFFFVLDEGYVDWNEWAFIKQEVAYTVQVLVSADGGEYELLKDFAQEYMGKTMDDLYDIDGFISTTLSLSEYKNKKIKVAFRYVGANGQTEFLDCVRIALPPMELSMYAPFSTLYYGPSADYDFSALNIGLGVYPVNAALTFMNNTWEDYKYTWHYCDPVTSDWATADGSEDLTLTYKPDYTSDFTRRNNLYYAPYLTATAEGFSDGKADMPDVAYIQAGGAPEWLSGETLMPFGLLPFNAIHSKIGAYGVAAADFGEQSIPIFGHSDKTAAWWKNYTFGEDATDDDACQVVSILNYIYPTPGATLVVNSAWVHAVGNVNADAEFTLGFHKMKPVYDEDGDYMGEVPDDVPFAKATLKGSDVLGNIETAYLNNLCLVFNFDEPVELTDESSSYIVKLSGFASDAVPYFAPDQQWKPSGLAFGWIEKEITFMNETRTSITPIANHSNEYGEMMCAFDINLGGYYPWLDAEDQTVELGQGRTGEISLATYYNGGDLKIESSDWIEASASGRYNECVVAVTADATADAREGFVTVSAPGVEPKTFKVTQETTGIGSVTVGSREVREVFTTSGTRTSLSDAPGIYIVRYNDGTVEKIVK